MKNCLMGIGLQMCKTLLEICFNQNTNILNVNILNMTELYGFPWWLSGKESAYQADEVDSVPGLGRSPGGGNGNPIQYSCLRNLMDRGAWWATVHEVAKSQTRLSD